VPFEAPAESGILEQNFLVCLIGLNERSSVAEFPQASGFGGQFGGRPSNEPRLLR